MQKPKSNKDMYDVVIIGAGIGGLVCGCYLAKAGMKVLIAEQHYKPGGYCTSFKRGEFTFDAAAHSFGSYREGGNLNTIFKGLDLDKRIKIKRHDPTNIIMTPEYKITFWIDHDKTIQELQEAFPNETKIRDFINFMSNPKPTDMAALRKKTFKDLLDQYFTSEKLKTILSFPLLGNGGLPPSLMSAFTGSKIFTEFLLDGGYYPEGGMQALADALADRFKEFGGELRLSSLVKKIRVKDNKVTGIVLEKGGFIPSRYVISNCDARQTFFKLLGGNIVSQDFLNKINNMIPSVSMFILYLGIDKSFNKLPKPGVNIWLLSQYNLDNVYSSIKRLDFGSIREYLMHISPDKKSIRALLFAPFKNRKYWDNNKVKLLESFITRIESDIIPGLSKYVIYKDAATPQTLYRYTLNYKGAAYGWAGIPSQLAIPDLRKPSFIQGLYLTGHWTTHGLGIPGVAYVGLDTAKLILRKEKK